MSKKKDNKILSKICYVVGSITVLVTACIAITEFMPRISGSINKLMVKRSNANQDDDDWGPVIERKKPDTKEDVENAD